MPLHEVMHGSRISCGSLASGVQFCAHRPLLLLSDRIQDHQTLPITIWRPDAETEFNHEKTKHGLNLCQDAELAVVSSLFVKPETTPKCSAVGETWICR